MVVQRKFVITIYCYYLAFHSCHDRVRFLSKEDQALEQTPSYVEFLSMLKYVLDDLGTIR